MLKTFFLAVSAVSAVKVQLASYRRMVVPTTTTTAPIVAESNNSEDEALIESGSSAYVAAPVEPVNQGEAFELIKNLSNYV
jgi:hypothetical protein